MSTAAPPAAALVARSVADAVPLVRAMSVKSELKNGASNLRISAFLFDTANNRPTGDPIPVDLMNGVGVLQATVGSVYLLDWRFDGLLGASVQITVNYPSVAPGAAGPQAAQVKHEDTGIISPKLGFNEGFLRVPAKDAIT